MSNFTSDSTHEFGFVTIATGRPDYSEMAVDLALSLREFHSNPICLLVDEKSEAYVRKNYPDVFDIIVRLTPRYRHTRTTKFAMAELVPFERAIFIDADTIVLSSVDTLIKQTVLKNFFMMGSFLPNDTNELHHGIPVRMLIEAFGLDSFFTSHSAAIGYQRNYARSFLSECYDVYVSDLDKLKWRLRGFLGDELAFGIVAGRRGMNIMEHPFPVLWVDELANLKPNSEYKPLCHFHDSLSDEALDWLMDEVAHRRGNAGLPKCSEQAWRAKSLRSAKRNLFKTVGKRIQSVLNRFH